jgi:CRP/FNR family transcriptional regulator, cyclic AMP receptor protein
MAQPQTALAVTKARPGRVRGDAGKRWASVLESIPLFAAVPKRQLRRIAALTREARYRRGTVIVRAGERGDDFFVILDGAASVVRPRGLPSIPLGPGSHFGEMALIDGEARSATVVAETDVHCLRLSRGPFLRLVRSEPAVAVVLLRHLAARVRELQSHAQLTA